MNSDMVQRFYVCFASSDPTVQVLYPVTDHGSALGRVVLYRSMYSAAQVKSSSGVRGYVRDIWVPANKTSLYREEFIYYGDKVKPEHCHFGIDRVVLDVIQPKPPAKRRMRIRRGNDTG